MFRSAWTFIVAMLRFATDRFRVVAKEEQIRRLVICLRCDQFDEPKRKCKACGCHVVAKAKIKSQNCPLEKW